MTKTKAAGRQAAKETIKEKRRRKAKETPADKAPRQSESPISERNPEYTTDDPQNPPAIGLDRGDLGMVSTSLKYGRLPLSDAKRERIADLLGEIMEDEDEPTRERLRAIQGLISAERINVSVEAAEDTPAIPPTITIVSDEPAYLRWRHEQARQNRMTLEVTDGDGNQAP